MREGRKHGFARRLRRDMTDAERRLLVLSTQSPPVWSEVLQAAPIGPYIADFACIERRLVVELDGGQHASADGDAGRTRFLARAGFRLLRFWDNDALTRTDDVLGIILQALEADAPSPQPLSRKRERG